MPVSISVNACRSCGCKSSTFIYIYKGFYYIISIFFITRWYGGFYKAKFFCFFSGFACFGLFYRKDAKFVFSLDLYRKGRKAGFFFFFVVLVKVIECRILLFLPENDILNYENDESSFENNSPSHDGRENPLCRGSAQKIGRTAGNSSFLKTKFQIFKIQIPIAKGFGFAQPDTKLFLLYISIICFLIYKKQTRQLLITVGLR
jgi:hypothetical protein